ncbi:hypothetical protein D3C84_626030 [compost metagenome]
MAALSQQVGPGSRDHQLADQVDQFVQLVRIYANVAVVFVFGLLNLVLLVQGRLNQSRRHRALLDQNFAQGCRQVARFSKGALFVQGFFQLLRRKSTAAD